VYTKEFKAGAVALAEKREKPVSQIAHDLGVNENVLYRWIQRSNAASHDRLPAFPGHGRPRDEELVRLRKEVKTLRTANEILKKRPDFSPRHLRTRRPPVMAYRFMKVNKGRYTIREMVGLFGVSSGACYQWVKNGVSERRSRRDAELLRLIREIQKRYHNRYGSPWVREARRKEYGKRVSRKKVAALMRENGLNARSRGKHIPTTNSTHGLPVCENILNQLFHAQAGGQKWVSSYRRYAMTYLRTTSGWVYLTVVLDLFDRKVIGWALSADMETVHTTIPAVDMAVRNRTPRAGLIFHSDRRRSVLREIVSWSSPGLKDRRLSRFC
jgi:transposase-like protein